MDRCPLGVNVLRSSGALLLYRAVLLSPSLAVIVSFGSLSGTPTYPGTYYCCTPYLAGVRRFVHDAFGRGGQHF